MSADRAGGERRPESAARSTTGILIGKPVPGRVPPKLPLPPLYEHVEGLFELNPVVLGIPPQVLVKADIICEHILTTYLFLLSRLAGGPALQLDPKCVP